MNRILIAGRYIFPLSFLLYVGLHLGKPEVGASFVPAFLPYPMFWNYFTLVCILLFITSAVLRRFDKLAYVLMALYVLLMAFLVHLPRAIGDVSTSDMMSGSSAELEMVNFFRNIMVTGALLAFAQFVAEDKRVIG